MQAQSLLPVLRTACYRWEVPVTTSSGSINLLEWLTELEDTLRYIYQFIKGDDGTYESAAR